MENYTNNVESAIKETISKPNIIRDVLACIGSAASGDPIAFLALLKKSIEKGGSVSNLLFYNKLEMFFIDVSAIDYEKRIRFLDKYVNENEAQFYHRIVLLLDSIDDLYKPHILSNLFHALCYEKIDLGMFFRLTNILIKLYIGDIYYLFENSNKLGVTCTIELHSLEAQSLVVSNPNREPFCLSDYGKLFLDYGLLNGVCDVFSKHDVGILKSNQKVDYDANENQLVIWGDME